MRFLQHSATMIFILALSIGITGCGDGSVKWSTEKQLLISLFEAGKAGDQEDIRRAYDVASTLNDLLECSDASVISRKLEGVAETSVDELTDKDLSGLDFSYGSIDKDRESSIGSFFDNCGSDDPNAAVVHGLSLRGKIRNEENEAESQLIRLGAAIQIEGGWLPVGEAYMYADRGAFERAAQQKRHSAKDALATLEQAIGEYRLDTGEGPDSLNELLEAPNGVLSWNGPYVREDWLKDPWGNKFRYKKLDGGGGYEITSFGSDGMPGGEGAAADITFSN